MQSSNSAVPDGRSIDEQSRLDSAQHIANKDNPHRVTKDQIGLDKVLNAQQATKVEFDALADLVANLGAPEANGQDRVTTFQTAAAPVEDRRVIVQDSDGTVRHADPSDASHAFIVLGLSLNAAEIGEQVRVVEFGWAEDDTWNFTPGDPVFVGMDGQLTQTPPEAPTFLFQLPIASAMASNRISVRPDVPLFLAA